MKGQRTNEIDSGKGGSQGVLSGIEKAKAEVVVAQEKSWFFQIEQGLTG